MPDIAVRRSPGSHRRERGRHALQRTRRLFASPLWKHPDFLRLWGGQTISLLGSRVTDLALPLTALLLLDASAGELGLRKTC